MPRVVITGGEGDLARAIGEAFRHRGWDVVAPGRSQLDVASSDSVNEFFGRITELDCLINNAGVTRDVVHARMSEADWDEVLDTCLKGCFLCSQAVLRKFPRKEGGHIINIGSFSGKSPPVGQANYAAAKAGLVGLSQSLAREYGSRNVRVNTVMPGFLETRMTANLSANAINRIRQRHTLGRFSTVEDAAQFMVNLCAMDAVSGQLFQLDSRI